MSRQRLVARGRVQGVLFRATGAEEARRLGVKLEIWNRSDGAVEAIAEGPDDALEAFARWMERGPRHARVDELTVEPLGAERA